MIYYQSWPSLTTYICVPSPRWVDDKQWTITWTWDAVNSLMSRQHGCHVADSIFIRNLLNHYADVIMGPIASQITSLTIVYSIVYSDADQKNLSKLRVTGLCVGKSPGQVNHRTKGQLRGKCSHLMTSSCEYIGILIQIPVVTSN